MLDFTSALYLGFEHPSGALGAWPQLTLGKPAALEAPPGAAPVAHELAALIGCERALLVPSTLHLFWDLFAILARRGVNIFVDGHAYAIARWGVERVAGRGTQVRTFRAHDSDSLRSVVERTSRRPPIIVADGYCPACGQAVPLARYLECAAERSGLLVIDDTQALGILGYAPEQWAPFGKGGGGSLQHAGLRDARVLLASSLAKAFGAPLAVLAGSEALITEFEDQSATRVYSSPPCVAVIAAAARATDMNRQRGDAVRRCLAARVVRLRRRLGEAGLNGNAGLFPVQSVRLPEGTEPAVVHEQLLKHGVRTVLHRDRHESAARISFVINVRHAPEEIDRAIGCLVEIAGGSAQQKTKGGLDS